MFGDNPIEDDPNLAFRAGEQRVFKTQLVLCLWIGLSSFVLFCFLRRRWPHMYAVRTLRKTLEKLQTLPTLLLGWVAAIYAISDAQVLEYSGLDAFVFLAFFKMGMAIFLVLAVLLVGVLSPVRYYFTGNYDKDNISWKRAPDAPDLSDDFPAYLWVYPVFVYVFLGLVYVTLFDYTKKVLRTRQKYLALQNSITDRTIRLDGIPRSLLRRNDPQVLKKFVEDLGIGRVTDVKLIYDWSPLERLFARRNSLLRALERLYSSNYGLKVDIYNQTRIPSVVPKCLLDSTAVRSARDKTAREKIAELTESLKAVDAKIRALQHRFDRVLGTINTTENPEFRLLPCAFITMDLVASAQMAAQTVLDPRVYKLMVTLAPAAKDIVWKNFRLTSYQKLVKAYTVTFVIILSYFFVIFLVTPLATLLDLKTISKLWPALGDVIRQSKWLTTFVTGILPPLLFLLLNLLLPYFYKYLSQCQGYASNSDVELSTLLKNFFFIFFNLFLVFTASGTFWDIISSISDTTKIAYLLAATLKKFLLFYVDLILLQGLAMFPVKLLQLGDFVILNIVGKLFLLKSLILRTPRDYRFYYYTPPVFDFGLHLPQHILIFIIILIYSVVSTKIVVSGLVYFVLGYFVYKYQLVYSFVHPPHSTGKVWPMIFRRVMLGLVIFQLFMCGTLALEGAILLAILCTPLILVTFMVAWNFERYYLPLSSFIALRAILNPFDFDKEFADDQLLRSSSPPNNEDTEAVVDESSFLLNEEPRNLRRRVSTVDEEREQFTDYTYPHLIDPLHGPWIGFEGDYVSMIQYRGVSYDHDMENADLSILLTNEDEQILRKRLQVSEWE